MQYLSASTRRTYVSWIERKASKTRRDASAQARLKVDIEPLVDKRSALLWLGDRRRAKKIVLFFHGGGYVAPMLPGHLEWCWRTYVRAGIETGMETAVAMLEYTLCPEAHYPVQLRQAVDALSHLLEAGVRPRDIVIGGDSAGGNLAAQLVSHLCEPMSLTPMVMLDEPLAGMFLVSPWLSNKRTDESFRQKGWIDLLSAETVAKSNIYYLGLSAVTDEPVESQRVAFPIDRDLDYLRRMSSVVKRIYVTAGSEEVFRDQAVRYASEAQQADRKVVVKMDLWQRMAHDFILLEGQEGVTGECMLAMKAWYEGVVTKA
jgi:acetyl esterase/lipase